MSDAGRAGIQPIVVDGTATQSRMAASGTARLLAVARFPNGAGRPQVHRCPRSAGSGMPVGYAVPGRFRHRRSSGHARRDGRVAHQQAQHRPIQQRESVCDAIASSACLGCPLTNPSLTRARPAPRCSDCAFHPGILRIISRSPRPSSVLDWVGSSSGSLRLR